ncbi:hypothetical protein GA0074695_1538 [Micromonospora viridifaciens]|uniref:Flavin reductase n=1 Tax=Micromonospora viridifaciens TaxID=1881 RepID=A0A1C4VKB4_MICVI|nr:flavin reductase [Micromonospora viridifaciens]SCE84251.1 hypothetical protein GA0074695_1538 [Micromonospora viridifaciens]
MTRPHLPLRPLWLCRACAQPWPCGPARLALLAEYEGARTALIVYLAACREEAREQLAKLNTSEPPPELTGRFLAWARSRR